MFAARFLEIADLAPGFVDERVLLVADHFGAESGGGAAARIQIQLGRPARGYLGLAAFDAAINRGTDDGRGCATGGFARHPVAELLLRGGDGGAGPGGFGADGPGRAP